VPVLIDQIQGFWPCLLVLVSLYILNTVTGIIGLRAWLQGRAQFIMVVFSVGAIGWSTNPLIYHLNMRIQKGLGEWQIFGYCVLSIILWAIGTVFVLLVYFQIEYMFRNWHGKVRQVLTR
jgi:hypothetical protein